MGGRVVDKVVAEPVVDKQVVDTNVLIVASAGDEASSFPADATPVKKADLRLKVLKWLIGFERGGIHLVMDYHWAIPGEYQRKISEQDYGWLVVKEKIDRNEIHWVGLEFDRDGHALLCDRLRDVVHDRADRKMVASALKAGGRDGGCNLVNACDTDWYDWEEALWSAGIDVEQLLDEWCRARWHRKRDDEPEPD